MSAMKKKMVYLHETYMMPNTNPVACYLMLVVLLFGVLPLMGLVILSWVF